MRTTSKGRCHDPPDTSYTLSERGIEAIEVALVTALFVVVIVGVFPLLVDGIGAALQSVTDAFAAANGAG